MEEKLSPSKFDLLTIVNFVSPSLDEIKMEIDEGNPLENILNEESNVSEEKAVDTYDTPISEEKKSSELKEEIKELEM